MRLWSPVSTSLGIMLGCHAKTRRPLVDYEDQGRFEVCPASLCTPIADVGQVITFTINSFTGYGWTEQNGPSLINITPINASTFRQNSNITISLNISEPLGVDTAYANITSGIGVNTILTLYNKTFSDIWNSTFTSTFDIGRYTIRFFANDSAGGRNATEYTIFTINDTTAPNVTALAVTPNLVNRNDIANLTVNVSDDSGLGIVLAQITLSNSSAYNLTLSNSGGMIFNGTILILDGFPEGQYTIRMLANDSLGNRNTSVTASFNASSISLNNTITDGSILAIRRSLIRRK